VPNIHSRVHILQIDPCLTFSQLAYKHWQQIIRLWPADPVRPATVSFPHIMRQRLSKLHPSPSSSSSTITTTSSSTSPSSPPTPAWDEAQELRQVNALYSLLENRYASANPLPPSLRHPASNPEHYDALLRELEEAPTRSWFGGVWKRIKGSLRFS
jgi:cytochrome b pre-mRNA-processing protein 6